MPEIFDSASRCSGVASMPTMPASASGLRPARTSVATRLSISAKPDGSPESGPSSSVDQADEVVAQPRDGGELQAVGHLVQGEPEPELARGEAVVLLDGHDVRPHVGHQVLVLGRLVVDEEVVLAEHPRGHVGQHQAQLGPRHGPSTASDGPPILRPLFAAAR